MPTTFGSSERLAQRRWLQADRYESIEPAGQCVDGARATMQKQDRTITCSRIGGHCIEPARDDRLISTPVIGDIAMTGHDRSRSRSRVSIGKAKIGSSAGAGRLRNDLFGL